ncbi:hypothetical protein H0H87_004248 [Tephrocybe sp. NHM501043]|nr:hypothetical protein H0H87_004248 [Tephrocybe sp. NHM501043]
MSQPPGSEYEESMVYRRMSDSSNPSREDWLLSAYDELMHNWRHAEDLETFEHVAKESVAALVGKKCDPDLQDDLIAYWQTAMPPARMLRVAETQGILMNVG